VSVTLANLWFPISITLRFFARAFSSTPDAIFESESDIIDYSTGIQVTFSKRIGFLRHKLTPEDFQKVENKCYKAIIIYFKKIYKIINHYLTTNLKYRAGADG